MNEGNDDPLTSLDVVMGDAVIGEDSTFRTQNTSSEDWERRRVIERIQGSIHTYVDLMDVCHGRYGDEDDEDDADEATLLVFRFRFDPQKSSRKVTRARVNIEFLAAGKKGSAPIVEAIAPEERWTVMPTTDQESTMRGGELNFGASGVPFLQAGGTAKLERTVSRELQDATTITGSINLGRSKNSGESTVAAWNLHGNKRRETGVPDSVKVAILLRREDAEPFNAMVTLEADMDFLSGLERKFSRVPLDDPVLFNPKLAGKKPKRGRSYGVQNLAAVDLYSLCEVRMALEAPFVASPETVIGNRS
ncbi:hypothetical protein ColLi_03933 [Colletotrichum liriopes]|uniref:Uncharacterized protein n=1 Tax=Colletotrichum liriopes TaxID=708192 RepID=A0AA37GHM5_9PEZI|nr:hypothetical protein ColLi_03933 [Colletotrichum liriopes]